MAIAKIFNELCEVTDITADTVKTIYYDCSKFYFLRIAHHFLEFRSLEVATGKSLIFINKSGFRFFLTIMSGDILTAHFNLVFNTFAFTGELGLS